MTGTIMWSPGVTLAEIERQVIEKAYVHFRHNKTATSQALGISVSTLDNKLKQYLEDDKVAVANLEAEKASIEARLARARGVHPANHGDNAATPIQHPYRAPAPGVSEAFLPPTASEGPLQPRSAADDQQRRAFESRIALKRNR